MGPGIPSFLFSSNRVPYFITVNLHYRVSWPYKKGLIIGAASGIGEALATRCVKAGFNVIVSGRTDKLEDFIH